MMRCEKCKRVKEVLQVNYDGELLCEECFNKAKVKTLEELLGVTKVTIQELDLFNEEVKI